MDPSQQLTVFQAIAASSMPGFSQSDRETGFRILEDLKQLPNRMAICLQWLQTPSLTFQSYDITVPTKLLALQIIQVFLRQNYKDINADERLALRRSILDLCRTESNDTLSRKVASILAGLILRDFPQRWTELHNDIFASPNGLWWEGGLEILLETFKLVCEDCLDSDFNSKISSTRRSDVLKGLLEISNVFLPIVFQLLEKKYAELIQSKANLHSMHTFLLSNQRTIHNMTSDETNAYHNERKTFEATSTILQNALIMLEKFILMLPPDIVFRSDLDFVAALLYFLREPVVQIHSLKCLETLASKGKMSMSEWLRIVTELPQAVDDSQRTFQEHQVEFEQTKRRACNDTSTFDGSVEQYEYYRMLSQVLATVVSAQMTHITTSKHILSGQGQKFDSLCRLLKAAASMLHHPSGRVASTQLSLWTTLLRDRQLVKFVQPFCTDILSACMDHITLINWESVEADEHPQSAVIQASFEDEEDYDLWNAEFRSRCSPLFRIIGETVPAEATKILNEKVQRILSVHGSGAPINCKDPSNDQLTEKSEAVRMIEALHHPLENVLAGIPEWAFKDDTNRRRKKNDANDIKRQESRLIVQSCASNIARLVVSWQPTFVWLKFRHAQLIESLRHTWKYEASTLTDAVNTLLRYLGLGDEWSPANTSGLLSPTIVQLKKKSGVALVNVSKHVPQQLVPWLAQFTEVARALLSSNGLIPLNQTHIFEFLTCVAIAVENPNDKAHFISDMLSDSIATLESPEVRKAVSSPADLLAAIGVSQVAERPELISDAAHVEKALSHHYKIFNPLNILISVGRRCQSAARKRAVVGGMPIDRILMQEKNELPAFPPDEGPISIQDLALSDPFVPLWPRILPTILDLTESISAIWLPASQATLLRNKVTSYALAISDEEVFVATTTRSHAGVYSEQGGTAGSIVSGVSRRDPDLRPKWSGMLSELRNSCYQLIGLLASQRVLYCPELSPMYPRLVSVLANPFYIKWMEHRHANLFLKIVVDFILLTCPASLYASHLAPILLPVLDSMRVRLAISWSTDEDASCRPASAFRTNDLHLVEQVFNQEESVFMKWYYSHGGLFVGDLDEARSETVTEKTKIEITRSYADILQDALALKGDWALTLANYAKEESAATGNRFGTSTSKPVNADGTPKLGHQDAIDARKLLRINYLARFLFVDNFQIASILAETFIIMLSFPDTYTCRRTVKLCHRFVEHVAVSLLLIGSYMFSDLVVKALTTLQRMPWSTASQEGII